MLVIRIINASANTDVIAVVKLAALFLLNGGPDLVGFFLQKAAYVSQKSLSIA